MGSERRILKKEEQEEIEHHFLCELLMGQLGVFSFYHILPDCYVDVLFLLSSIFHFFTNWIDIAFAGAAAGSSDHSCVLSSDAQQLTNTV